MAPNWLHPSPKEGPRLPPSSGPPRPISRLGRLGRLLGAGLARPHWACGRPTPGEPIPTELLEKVRAAKTFRAASAMVRQLVFAQTDLAIHSTPFEPKVGAAAEIYREVRLQHPAAPCSTLRHTATHRNPLEVSPVLQRLPTCNMHMHMHMPPDIAAHLAAHLALILILILIPIPIPNPNINPNPNSNPNPNPNPDPNPDPHQISLRTSPTAPLAEDRFLNGFSHIFAGGCALPACMLATPLVRPPHGTSGP